MDMSVTFIGDAIILDVSICPNSQIVHINYVQFFCISDLNKAVKIIVT